MASVTSSLQGPRGRSIPVENRHGISSVGVLFQEKQAKSDSYRASSCWHAILYIHESSYCESRVNSPSVRRPCPFPYPNSTLMVSFQKARSQTQTPRKRKALQGSKKVVVFPPPATEPLLDPLPLVMPSSFLRQRLNKKFVFGHANPPTCNESRVGTAHWAHWA